MFYIFNIFSNHLKNSKQLIILKIINLDELKSGKLESNLKRIFFLYI